MTNLSIIYAHSPGITLREADENGGLLFNPDTNQVQVLNSTGIFIWSQCDGTRNLAELLQALDQEFAPIPVERVQDDVEKFLTNLKEEGFLAVLPAKET